MNCFKYIGDKQRWVEPLTKNNLGCGFPLTKKRRMEWFTHKKQQPRMRFPFHTQKKKDWMRCSTLTRDNQRLSDPNNKEATKGEAIHLHKRQPGRRCSIQTRHSQGIGVSLTQKTAKNEISSQKISAPLYSLTHWTAFHCLRSMSIWHLSDHGLSAFSGVQLPVTSVRLITGIKCDLYIHTLMVKQQRVNLMAGTGWTCHHGFFHS